MATWLVTNGQSIQAAIAGASDGDTIAVDAGVYTENLTIDKAVTILGVNHGIAEREPENPRRSSRARRRSPPPAR